MKLVKVIGYYAYSALEIILNIKNWFLLIPLFLRTANQSRQIVKLRRPPVNLRVRSAMDVWSIKETFLDAFYTRYGVPVQDGWTVIDIGAAIGDFSIYAAFDHPNAIIYAFEPFPESYQLLIKNLTLNAISNVIAFQQAIWRQQGALMLDLAGGEPLQIASKETGSASEPKGTLSVEARTLTSVIEEYDIRVVDLLKLDCEGAEYAILLNTSHETLAKIPRIVMEYHDVDEAHTHKDLIRFFEGEGYRVTWHTNVVHDHIGYLFAERGAAAG